jgi:hypothetical protein
MTTTPHPVPGYGPYNSLLRWLVVGALAVVVAACDQSSDAGSSDSETSGVLTTSSSATPSGRSGDPVSADPEAMGVDTVDWPGDVPGGYAVLKRLPRRLAGEQVSVHKPVQNLTLASYGKGDQAATISVMGTDETLKDPQSALSFLFGMVYSCDKSTFVGTAKSDDGGYTPALGNGDSGEEPVWFSCDVDGAEGSPKFTGQAVGWTSGETAWLAMSGDGRMMKSMMRALVKAGN